MGARTVPEKGRPRVMRAGTFAREMESAARAPATADPAQVPSSSRMCVASSCPGDFLRPHGRIGPSVSRVRGFQTSGGEEERWAVDGATSKSCHDADEAWHCFFCRAPAA
ncbi:uncharacterized protein LOC124707529 isoform X2 [Lolium rigidum]|uniref:uncharacterized protein LOC124707529 isoform X2 n=1 Tax=Lolium rigidum TaxID=89674 RepID=UPI001F5D6931|nr:uncharacterized protein LOC124707529 isoform X2 [Lolium rigidum]